MTFKKLALVTAIACAPMASFGVESLDDAALSAATGQDGLAIGLDLSVNTDTIIHDTDGIDAAYQTLYGFAGAIVVTGLDLQATGIEVEIDAGDDVIGTTANAPTLNVHVNLANGVTLQTGTVGVANSNRDNSAWGATGTVNVLNNMTVSVGATDLNIQLGNEPQGAMISIVADVTNGLTLNNLGITDAGGTATYTGGTIGASVVTLMNNNDPTMLSVNMGINVVDNGGVSGNGGLRIDINQLGDAVNGMDVRIERQYLGTVAAGYVGDVEVVGLDLTGAIIISGK